MSNSFYFLRCSQCEENAAEIEQLKSKLESEMDMRQNRDLQLNELEQTLAKESQRAADLKVQKLFLTFKIRLKRAKNYAVK